MDSEVNLTAQRILINGPFKDQTKLSFEINLSMYSNSYLYENRISLEKQNIFYFFCMSIYIYITLDRPS